MPITLGETSGVLELFVDSELEDGPCCGPVGGGIFFSGVASGNGHGEIGPGFICGEGFTGELLLLFDGTGVCVGAF